MEQLSKMYHVTPLKEGEVATFKLIGSGKLSKRKTDLKGNPVPQNRGYLQVGKETIFDKGKNQRILMQNVTSWQDTPQSDGGSKQVPVISNIMWPSTGVMTIHSDENEKYFFMKRSNKNKDNPNRDKTKKAQYYEIHEDNDTIMTLKSEELIDYARAWVREAGITELRATVNKLSETLKGKVNLDWNIEEMKLALLKLTQTYAKEIIVNSDFEEGKQMVQLVDADRFNIIFFDTAIRAWYFSYKIKDTATVFLDGVEPGKDRFTALREFINTDEGKEPYEYICKTLMKIYKGHGVPA